MKPQAGGPGWSDLPKRLISAALMLLIGGVEIWLGGAPFAALVLLLSSVMMWELATITARGGKSEALSLALLMGLSMVGSVSVSLFPGIVLLIFPALGLVLTPRIEKPLAALIALAIALAGYGLMNLRDVSGDFAILWLVGVVIASDVLGYFAGRLVGGPKFWPAISPKKTWSGTIAGLMGAAGVGAVFVWLSEAPAGLIVLSMFAAFAGQMGDICESLIKRRTGVKDSSNLIPGHGGVMDRFDALTGSAVLLVVLSFWVELPLPAGR
jgi:phosphatidate cytidylyltransferase